MRRYAIAVAALGVLSVPSTLRAQSASDVAGWIALITTPVGAFGPSVFLPPVDGSEVGLQARGRYAHWQFAPDDDNTTNLGVGLSFPSRMGRVTFEVGRTTKKECSDCDAVLFGAELNVPLTGRDHAGGEPYVAVAAEPSLGYMQMTAGGADLSALAVGVSLPLTVTVPTGGMSLAPFVSPGVGFGQLSGGNNSESGERVMLAGGVAVAAGVMQLTVGARKIFIDGAPTLYGVSLSLGL